MKGVIPRAEVEAQALRDNACPNCGVDLRYKMKDGRPAKGGHFVPPSFGADGYWACSLFNAPPSQQENLDR